MKILLIIKKEKKHIKKIIELFKKNFANLKIIDHNEFHNNLRNDYDYVICYLSKKILKSKFLNQTRKLNINIHPGSSNYPGIGCFNFALYSNEETYGAVAHIINEKIDNGKIIKEVKFTINKNYNVAQLANITYKNMIFLTKDIVKMIKKDNIIFSKIKWKRKAYTRNDLNKLAEIKINYSKKRIYKIIKCLYMPSKPAPYIYLKGVKFEYSGS